MQPDIENRAVALAIALCDARADVSGPRGERTGAGLVCVLPRWHEEDLHYDACDRVWWRGEAGERAEAVSSRG